MPYATNPDDGVRIYYEVEGDGPPLIFHHGGGSSLKRWRELGYVDALRDAYRLILFDARGHGRSDKPTTPDAYCYQRWVADVVAILDDLDIEQAHFFGYSVGGLVGFRIPLHAPERFRSLILGGAHPYGLRDFWQSEYERFKDGGKVAIEDACRAGRTLPDVEIEAFRSGAREAIALAFREEPAVADLLPSFAIPTLVFVGADDTRGDSSRHAPEAARLIPNATFLMFSGFGHFETIQRHDLLLPHVRAFIGIVEKAT